MFKSRMNRNAVFLLTCARFAVCINTISGPTCAVVGSVRVDASVLTTAIVLCTLVDVYDIKHSSSVLDFGVCLLVCVRSYVRVRMYVWRCV